MMGVGRGLHFLFVFSTFSNLVGRAKKSQISNRMNLVKPVAPTPIYKKYKYDLDCSFFTGCHNTFCPYYIRP